MKPSIFAGVVMFTEPEVLELRTLSKVSRPSLVAGTIYNVLQCELDQDVLRAHYNSYLAAGFISMYNPTLFVCL